jgi:Zn finger protein HypA/HybF involved in hydrogenase expression
MLVESARKKEVYHGRREQGNCPRCGIKVKKSSKYIMCEDCRLFFREYTKKHKESINETRKALYDARKEKRKCPRCGISLGKKYKKTICPECLEKQYKYNTGKERKVKA